MSFLSDESTSSFSGDEMVSLPDSPPPVNFLERLSNECLLLIIEKVILPKHVHTYPETDVRSLKSLSLVNRKVRQLCIPTLFRTPHLRSHTNEHSTAEQLKAMVEGTFVTSNLRSLKMRIYRDRQDPTAPQEDLGRSLVSALAAMPKLEALSLILDNHEDLTSNIRTAFRTSKISLPTVKILEALKVPNASFLLRACPSLEKLTTPYPSKQWKKTFEAVAAMSNIQAVWMTNPKGWKLEHFREILPYVAHVSELCLRGDIFKTKLSNLVPLFSNMSNLKSLYISTEQWVNYPYLRTRYFNDRFLDAVDDLKATSPYNEEADIVAQAFFDGSQSITTLRLVSYFTQIFRFTREQKNGSVVGIGKAEEEDDWAYDQPDFPGHYY